MKRLLLAFSLLVVWEAKAAWIVPGGGGSVNTAAGTNTVVGIVTNTPAISNYINTVISTRVGPGILGQVALFGTTTTNVTNSVIFQGNTNLIEYRQDYTQTGPYTNYFTNRWYGEYTSAANYNALETIAAKGHGNGYYQLHGVQAAPVGASFDDVWPLILHDAWTFNSGYRSPIGLTTGYLTPIADDTQVIGTSGLRLHRIAMGTGAINYFGVPAETYSIGNNNWGIAFNQTNIAFYRNVASSPVQSTRFSTISPDGTLGWDFAGNVLTFGNSMGGGIAHIKVSGSSDLGIVQIGTNNAGATTPQKAGITGSIGTGTDHGGATLELKVGSGTGTARNGDFSISTAPSTASSGSTANSSYVTNFYIASQPVTLTENNPTLFANITVPSGKVVGFTVDVTVEANDSTDFQSDHQVFAVTCVNKAGTVTVTYSASVPSANAASAGTLSATYTAVANGNSCDLKCNAVSSLTQTTLKILGGTIIHLQGSAQSVITSQ